MLRILEKVWPTIVRWSYEYYFVFESKEKISKFIPASEIEGFDSYYILSPEKLDIFKQQILNGTPIKEPMHLCYAIVPALGCCAPAFALDILSNSISEPEFEKLVEIVFNPPYKIRHLLKEEVETLLSPYSFYMNLI